MSAIESWYATRTMRALELLAFRSCSASEVARGLQVHPRTARRLLNRLVVEGYVTRTDGERRMYATSMRIVALAGQVVQRSELAGRTAPFVSRLQAECGHVSHLTVPSYRSVLCLVHSDGGAREPVRPHLRELLPCHCTAAGKTLLAFRNQWRASVLAQPLERLTERTLVEPAALEREAERIRELGFATEDREYRPELRGVAAPVRDESGEVVAALGIAASAAALASEEFVAHAECVRDLAATASAALGYADPADAPPDVGGHG